MNDWSPCYHVEGEGEVFGDILGGPVTEEGIEKSLVSSIKRSRSNGMGDK